MTFKVLLALAVFCSLASSLRQLWLARPEIRAKRAAREQIKLRRSPSSSPRLDMACKGHGA